MSLRLPRLLFPRFSPLLRLRSPLLLLSDTSESIKSHVDWSMRNVTKHGNKATSSSQVTRYVCSAVLDQHVCWSCASFEKSSVGCGGFLLHTNTEALHHSRRPIVASLRLEGNAPRHSRSVSSAVDMDAGLKAESGFFIYYYIRKR